MDTIRMVLVLAYYAGFFGVPVAVMLFVAANSLRDYLQSGSHTIPAHPVLVRYGDAEMDVTFAEAQTRIPSDAASVTAA